MLVITVIESLRAFDIVYVINGGRNGLELLSVLVTQNIVGEASRIGFGSAIAVILLRDLAWSSSSSTWRTFREEQDDEHRRHRRRPAPSRPPSAAGSRAGRRPGSCCTPS